MNLRRTFVRLAISIVSVVTFSLTASAQDAQTVLRLWVQYNSVKNASASSLGEAAKAEVARLDSAALAANASHNYGEAMKDYYHAIAIMRGIEWTPSRALGFGMKVTVDRSVVEPESKIELRIGQIFKLDQLPAGPVSCTIDLVAGTAARETTRIASLATVGPDFATNPSIRQLMIPRETNGNYQLHLTLSPAAGEPVSKDINLFVEKGLPARATGDDAAAAGLESKVKKTGDLALLGSLSSAEYRLALYDLANSGKMDPKRIDFDKELNAAETELKEIAAGHNPYSGRQGDMRKAYRSRIDSTLQPYRIFVPSTYDGSRAFPLVIALHGMGGDESSIFDQYGNGAFKSEAEKHGYIVACPKGREPASMYTGPAEQDVLDVISEVERDYKVDLDRVYMTGHSMGAFGTWSIAIDHPDLFAAIAPISGGGDPKKIDRIARIPELVVHGDNDNTVPVQRSREMVEAGKKVGAEIKYIEVPGGTHVGVALPAFKDIFEWFDAHRRKPEGGTGAPSTR
jgi:predicted esterase